MRGQASNYNPAGVAITGGTIIGANVPYVLAQSAIPFISISSGSIGNNGALTGVTALPQTYSGGAYVFYAANTIAAATAAGWYWTVFSSGTAGIIFNSTYTSGIPVVGTSTAFVTTGQGAYTGTVVEDFGPLITLPANSLGPNGMFRVWQQFSLNNTAGAKTLRARFSGTGGTIYQAFSAASAAGTNLLTQVFNRGVTNSQVGTGAGSANPGFGFAIAVASQVSAVDTTAGTTISLSFLKGVATDNIVQDSFMIEVVKA